MWRLGTNKKDPSTQASPSLRAGQGPIIGITTGDPKGIGPEIVCEALEDSEIRSMAEFKIFGPKKSDKSLPDLEAARLTLDALHQAVDAALNKEIDILVTAPLNKARMRLVDKGFLGHTEFLAAKCQASVAAMFVAKNWRVALVTRHLPLSQVALKLNAMDILNTIRMAVLGLQKYFKILDPKIAVSALNPHAGERGLFGDEELKLITPAIEQARKEGLDVEGPFSPDTLFWQMIQGRFDAVVAMYHDQGLIPIKTLAFKECVQLTLGLPFLRLSCDHGTAEDLVGTGKADPHNIKTAIRLACQLA